MNFSDQLYTIKALAKPEEMRQQIEETFMIVVSMLTALDEHNKLTCDMANYYLKAINNLIRQSFEIYDHLYKISAYEAELYRKQHPLFLLNKQLSHESLNNHLCALLYQLASLTEYAIDDGLLSQLTTTCANILLNVSFHIHELIMLIEALNISNQKISSLEMITA